MTFEQRRVVDLLPNRSTETVAAWLRQHTSQSVTKRSTPVSPQKVAWLILKADPSKHRYLKALCRASPEIASLAEIARQLFEMIRMQHAAAWPAWLDAAENSPFASFARRLRRDNDAILAALQMPWSNSKVEGQIHRLKLIKRQMYGRAGFDLIRLRVLESI